MKVDVFRESGTWHKPDGARIVNVVLIGASSSDGNSGETVTWERRADDLTDAVQLTVGTANGGNSAGAVAADGVTMHGGGGVGGGFTATGNNGRAVAGRYGDGGSAGSSVKASDGLVVVITRFEDDLAV